MANDSALLFNSMVGQDIALIDVELLGLLVVVHCLRGRGHSMVSLVNGKLQGRQFS